MNAVPDPEPGLRGCLGSQPGQDIDSAVAGTSQLFARRQLAGLLDHQTLTKLVLESQPSTWSNSEANNTFSQKLALVRERAVPALQLLLYAGHPAHQHTSSIIWALQHTHCAEAALVLADYTRHCLIPDPNADRATCDELALRAFTALSKQGQTGRPLRQALVHEWLTGASTSDKLLERAIQDYTRDSTVREKLIETGRFVLRCLRQTERPLTTSAKGRITSFYDTLVQIDDILSKPPVENCSIAIDILRPLSLIHI